MSEMHKTRQTAEKGVDHASKILEDIKDRASDYAGDAKSKGKEFYNEARSRIDDTLDDAQTYGKGALKDAQSWVKKNPALAVGGAVVFGMLLKGTLLSNRDNDIKNLGTQKPGSRYGNRRRRWRVF